MSKKIYIAKLSGGKDSTAMVDLLLRNNYPLDYILFATRSLSLTQCMSI